MVSGVVAHREAIPQVGQPGARGRAWVAASVLAAEHAVEAVAGRLAGRDDAPCVGRLAAAAMIQEKQAALGHPLTPVHRMQGATVDRAHVFADGGGRELAYVAMSRARDTSHVYVVADDPDQAVDDLTVEWSADRRQRWVLDVDEPAVDGQGGRPSLARRSVGAVRVAQLRAECGAVQAVAPNATRRLEALDTRLRLQRLAVERMNRPRVS